MTLTLGSLFSGIGGFDRGFEDAGFQPVFQVENDPVCRRVLARHWPDVPRFADVRDCGVHNLPPCDVLAFGSPCQDMSIAGKRKGLGGERSGLFYEAIRIIGELRPSLVVWENVPGALSSHAGRDFRSVLVAFRELGARDLAWRTLDSQHFGVPQRRRRLFLVADFGGERAAEILFEREGVRGDTAARGEAREDATPVARRSAPGGGGRGDTDRMTFVPVTARQQRSGGNMRHREDQDTLIAHALTSGGADASEDGTGRGTPLVTIAATLQASGAGTGRPAGMASEPDFLVAAPLCIKGAAIGRKPENGPQRGEITEDGTTFTLNCTEVHAVAAPLTARCGKGPGSDVPEGSVIAFDWQSGGEVRHNVSATHTSALQASETPAVSGGMTVRRLTPTECERLQAFGDGWTAVDAEGQPISDSARYRMLGNACTVNVCRWIAHRIKAVVESHPA